MTETVLIDPFQNPETLRYFEDYVPGSIYEFGQITATEDEIIEFGRKFDPQEFHVDPDKARDTHFGGLIASGWHTASLMMRLFGTHYLSNASSLGSPGISNLRWLAPVRPGDELSIRVQILLARRSSSKPDRGIVSSNIEVQNQDGVVVMDLTAVNLIASRETALQD